MNRPCPDAADSTGVVVDVVVVVVIVVNVVAGGDFLACLDGGKRTASQDGHNIKSPWLKLTLRLFTFCGQGPSGKPSQRGMTADKITLSRYENLAETLLRNKKKLSKLCCC